MKKDIHPQVFDITARCACGQAFQTVSTDEEVQIDICSACHPVYTGQQKFVDTAGRVERFMNRYGNQAQKAKK